MIGWLLAAILLFAFVPAAGAQTNNPAAAVNLQCVFDVAGNCANPGDATNNAIVVMPSGAATFPANITQFGGTNISTGTGVSGAGIPRVTVSSDSSLTANQGTAAAGTGAWPVAVTTTGDVIVKTGDSVNNAVRVNVVAGGGAGGTSSNFNAAFPATGTAIGAQDTGGNMQSLTLDGAGSGKNLKVNCAVGCSGGPADESAFIFGTTSIISGGVYQTTPSSNPLTNSQAGVVQMTATRSMFMNLRDSAGNEIGTSTNPFNVKGSVTVTASTLAAVSNAAPIYAPGTSQALSLTPAGALRVDGGSSGTFPDQHTDIRGNFNTTTNFTQPMTLFGVGLPAAGGAVIGGTSTNPLRTDPTGTTAEPVNVRDGSGTAITSTGAALDVNLKTSSITLGVSGTVTANQGSANATPWNENVAQFGGTNVSTGTGASGAGIPRVTISNDSSLAANQSVNVAQINGVTPLMGNGGTGTGAQRVTLSSDNSAVPAWGQGATGAAVPAGATLAGAQDTGGNMATFTLDGAGAGKNLKVNCAVGCSGGPADESAFTFGTTAIFTGGVYQTNPASNQLTTGQAGSVQMTSTRSFFVNLRDAGGNAFGTSANPLQVNDVAAVYPGTVAPNMTEGFMIHGAVGSTPPVYAPGRNQPISLTQTGALRVDGTYGGTFANQQTNVTGSFNTTANSQTQPITLWGLALPAAGGAVVGGTSTNPLRIDPTGTTTQPANVAQFGGNNVVTGTGTGGNGIPRVTVSSDSSLAANQSVNVSQMNGVNTSMGNGTTDTGTQRVTLSSDSTGQVTLAAGAATIGALTANQSVNMAQVGGTALSGANVVDAANTAFRVNCVTGCVAGGSFTDNSAFTIGGTTETNIGGVFNDGVSPISSGNAAALRLTSYRALHVNLRDPGGNVFGTGSNPLWVHSVSALIPGTVIPFNTEGYLVQGAVSQGPRIYAPGRNQPLTMTTQGALFVDGTYGLFPDQHTDVRGNFNTTSGFTQPLTMFGLALPGSGGAVAGGTTTNPVNVATGSASVLNVTIKDGSGNALGTMNNPLQVNDVFGVLPGTASPALTEGIIGHANVVAATPFYTPGRNQPLTMTTTGALTVDLSATRANPTPINATSWGVGSAGPAPTIVCDQTAIYDASTSGSTQMVALMTGKQILVCGYAVTVGGTATNVKLVYGTGTNCATGAVNMTPAYQIAVNGGIVDHPPLYNGLATAPGNALCVNASAANAVQAIVYFATR